jgi:hypothetical protein
MGRIKFHPCLCVSDHLESPYLLYWYLHFNAIKMVQETWQTIEFGTNTRNSGKSCEETSVVFICRPKLLFFCYCTVSSLSYQLLKFVCVKRAADILFETQVCGPVRNFRYEMRCVLTHIRYRSKKWLDVNIVGFINDRTRQANILEKIYPHVRRCMRHCWFFKISP